jgi:hypothetical protein
MAVSRRSGSATGKKLFYIALDGRLMAVAIRIASTPQTIDAVSLKLAKRLIPGNRRLQRGRVGRTLRVIEAVDHDEIDPLVSPILRGLKRCGYRSRPRGAPWGAPQLLYRVSPPGPY